MVRTAARSTATMRSWIRPCRRLIISVHLKNRTSGHQLLIVKYTLRVAKQENYRATLCWDSGTERPFAIWWFGKRVLEEMIYGAIMKNSEIIVKIQWYFSSVYGIILVRCLL